MKTMSLVGVVLAAAVTMISMAWEPTFRLMTLVNLGFISINPFDVLLGGAVLLLVIEFARREFGNSIPVLRWVLWLCAMYFAYQVLIVIPWAVLVHDLRGIDVVREIHSRLLIALVPFFYVVALRYWRPSVLLAVFDIAAVVLAAWVLYTYLTTGGSGYWDGGIYRLRIAWGGTSLAFGWLILTSLFYWKPRIWNVAAAVIGAAGLLLVNHRSGIVALLAAFLVQVVALRGVGRRLALVAVVAAVIGVGVYFSSDFVRESLAFSFKTLVTTSADPNAADRVERSVLGLEYFAEHPWGDYVWNRRYYLVNLGKGDFVPHNMVVQLLVTQGAIATALYLLPLTLTMIVGWLARARREAAVMLAYVVFYVVFCLLNANIEMAENMALLYVAMAIILDARRRDGFSLSFESGVGAEISVRAL